MRGVGCDINKLQKGKQMGKELFMKMRAKKEYPENFRTSAGFALTPWAWAFSGVVFSIFMQYLTDYSGIDSAVGQVGFAAAFGTIFLFISRIIDAVDDPLQAWIMDSAKECKFGKYRRFTLISVCLIATGLILLFSMPDAVKANKVAIVIWVFVGYIIMECGNAFFGAQVILQKSTTNPKVRSKLMTIFRFSLVVAVIPATLIVAIATAVNAGINNIGKAFTITVFVVVMVYLAISVIGILLLKEPYRPTEETEGETKKKEMLSIKEILQMFKANKALWVHMIGMLLGTSTTGLAGMVVLYFLKWVYCANMTTGEVDNVLYATIYGTYGLISLLPNFLGPFFASFLVKKLGSVDRACRACYLSCGIGFVFMFILYLTGILQSNPMIFLGLYFLINIPAATATVPTLLLNAECGDYAEYTTGKTMTALTNSVNSIFTKTQTAINTAIPGILLVIVGYSVNSETGNYAGDLSKLPDMVNGFAILMTLVPAIIGLISWAVYKFLYPITPELRATMTEELGRRRKEKQLG